MTESDLWQTIKPKLPALAQATRIENAAMNGAFDTNVMCQGIEVWIELKIVRSKRLSFKNTQANWMRSRIVAGGANGLWAIARHIDEIFLFRATQVLNVESKPDSAGKSFSVLLADLKPSVVLTPRFDWPRLWATVFGREV